MLFLDYQNAYKAARQAFHEPGAPPPVGQIDPSKLGKLLAARRRTPSTLAAVRVYRGQPDSSKESHSFGAVLRQRTSWERDSIVHVFMRRLRYPSDWPDSPPEEKGIDVALAVDFVAMAIRNEYDVGVIMSTDSDLRPALEAVLSLGRGSPRCEVAAWAPRSGHRQRLAVPGRRIWCHWLDEFDYRVVADPRVYSHP